MQLSKLNGAIRGADTVKVRFSFGDVAVQKTSLLEALKAHHEANRTAETGLELTSDGYLSWLPGYGTATGPALSAQEPRFAAEIVGNDDEDLSSLA